MLADELDFVVGVDPHRDAHAFAVVEVRTGVVAFESLVGADPAGYAETLRCVEEHAPGRRAFAIEGVGSFGAGLARFLVAGGEQVYEVGRLRREADPEAAGDAAQQRSSARPRQIRSNVAALADRSPAGPDRARRPAVPSR
jgi:transposase